MDAEDLRAMVMSRRSALKRGAATAFLLSQAALFEQVAKTIIRPEPAYAATTFSDIQFDMGAFINPAVVPNDGAGNVTAQFPPTYAMFLPAKLNRTPTVAIAQLLGYRVRCSASAGPVFRHRAGARSPRSGLGTDAAAGRGGLPRPAALRRPGELARHERAAFERASASVGDVSEVLSPLAVPRYGDHLRPPRPVNDLGRRLRRD
jgi:hypothetical protein